jgi:hypothetical protein
VRGICSRLTRPPVICGGLSHGGSPVPAPGGAPVHITRSALTSVGTERCPHSMPKGGSNSKIEGRGAYLEF